MSNPKWNVRCVECGWRGTRTPQGCECYEYRCTPAAAATLCPNRITWPCPRCGTHKARRSWGNPDGSSVITVGRVGGGRAIFS